MEKAAIPYAEAAKRVRDLRSQAREVLAQIEKKSAPLNSRQREIFEEWLDETFQVSSLYKSWSIDDLISKLKAVEN